MTWLMGRKVEGWQIACPQKPWAAVMVQMVARDVVEVGGGPVVMNPDVEMVPLPDGIRVLGGGKEIQPSPGKKFLITTETFDPYHLLTESWK